MDRAYADMKEIIERGRTGSHAIFADNDLIAMGQ